MMARTHLAFGAAFAAGAGASGLVPLDVPLGAMALFGSLLPDIDHPRSTFGRRVPFLSIPLAAAFGHRGFTHSALAAFLVVLGEWALLGQSLSSSHAPAWIVSATVGLGLGYLSHLFGDWLTVSGIPLLWPLQDRWRCRPFVSTGGVAERLIQSALLVGLAAAGLHAASAPRAVEPSLSSASVKASVGPVVIHPPAPRFSAPAPFAGR